MKKGAGEFSVADIDSRVSQVEPDEDVMEEEIHAEAEYTNTSTSPPFIHHIYLTTAPFTRQWTLI